MSVAITAPRLLRLPEVLNRTGLSRSSIYLAVKRGTFPAPAKIGTRASAWSENSVTSWIEIRLASSREKVQK